MRLIILLPTLLLVCQQRPASTNLLHHEYTQPRAN